MKARFNSRGTMCRWSGPRTRTRARWRLNCPGGVATDSMKSSCNPDTPSGFCSRGRPFPLEAECIAFPEIIPQEKMDVAIHDILGASERFERGQGMDLYTIRDYVTSDSARHVDWKATAKTSSLKTREFAAEESRRVVLAFDRYGVAGDRSRFESLVSYAASLAVHMTRDGIELSLVSDEWSSSSGHSETLLQSILGYLALVEMNPVGLVAARGTVRRHRHVLAKRGFRLVMERYFQLSFHALILTAFVALADTGRLDIPSIFVFIFFFAWIARRTVMGRGAAAVLPDGIPVLGRIYLLFRLRCHHAVAIVHLGNHPHGSLPRTR